MRKRLYEIAHTADPDDKISIIYDKFMMITIIISIIPLFFKSVNHVFHMIEVVTTVIFIIDYLLKFATADFKLKSGTIFSFIKYPFTPFAIIDLLSILPWLCSMNKGFRLFRLLRLNRAFRTLKFLRYSKNFNIILTVVEKQKSSLLAVCYLLLGYITLSALIMFSAEPDTFENFFHAVYWSVVTLTTVGYGDIYPVSNLGRVISMISSLVGIAIVALPTGIFTAGFTTELERLEQEKDKDTEN